MSLLLTENVVEEFAIGSLVASGAGVRQGSELAEAGLYLSGGLIAALVRDALERFNPHLLHDEREQVLRVLGHPPHPSLIENNRWFHGLLTNGIPVEYKDAASAETRGGFARLIDFDNPANNDFLVVRQLTVAGPTGKTIRADLVLCVNGLPLVVIELKDPANTAADLNVAIDQLGRYKTVAPDLFVPNLLLVASDGLLTRVGSITSGRQRFTPWRPAAGGEPTLEALIRELLNPAALLDYLRSCVVFEEDARGNIVKKIAGYHQFRAVRKARAGIIQAIKTPDRQGDEAAGKGGVVWHTQGSGKSLTMLMLAGTLVRAAEMTNPTLVIVTDRNDLDDQLFATFARCRDLLRQDPVQAADRADLRAKLAVGSGGVVFTTIQKFMPDERGDSHPVLSDRRNIVVIADEAHRSQYDFIDGFARHLRDALPGAAFIGFTGTPIELTDANTRSVFGDYISIYDIQRAVHDGATVPIYYESRLAKLELAERERPKIDPAFEEVTEGEEVERTEKLKSRWAQLEALVGSEHRLKLVAADLVRHYEDRLAAMDGKAMVVAMSRRIAVDLYDEIARLRPEWVGDGDEAGSLKVIMTGSAMDPLEWQDHIRNKSRREALAARFRNPADPFRMVIVRDMWLTGFDAPSLSTMYLDKPMRGHGLMQAIARVNRVFRDKPGGLVVDYLGIADELRKALATYTEAGGSGETAIDQAEAVAVLLEKYEVCAGLFYGFDHSHWVTGNAEERVELLPRAQEFILAQEDGKPRLLNAVANLSAAFALASASDEARRIRDDVGFYQAVRAVLAKGDGRQFQTDEQLNAAVRQIVSGALVSGEVMDVFAAAGLRRPDISILSDEFLDEIKGMPHKNLAVELLQKLLTGEIRSRGKKNVVQSRSFAEMLDLALRRYQARAIETAQVIEELIALAKEIRDASVRGEALGLTDDELAFYDALETNDSAVAVLGDEKLRGIARELAEKVRANVTIDWTVRENVRAQLRVLVKRILRTHGYPPDKQEKAAQLVLEQAEALSELWAAA